MMTIGETYNSLKKRLAATGEAEAEAGAILAHVLGCDIGALHLRFLHDCPMQAELETLVEKRLSGMPLAYVLQSKYFYGYEFYVDSRVLIPRWDSECVAQCAILLIQQHGYASALDLCCGSGCLGISLLLETGLSSLEFSDISSDALDVARHNAGRLVGHAAQGRQIRFSQADLFGASQNSYDLIICNPPYISAKDYAGLEAQIKNYEPQGALLANQDGYAFYQRIAREAGEHLNNGGSLVLEIGSTQGDKVMQLLRENGFQNIHCGCDLSGRPRVVSSEKTKVEQ